LDVSRPIGNRVAVPRQREKHLYIALINATLHLVSLATAALISSPAQYGPGVGTPVLRSGRQQIDYLLTGLLHDHFRHKPPVAVGRIAFEAKQAHAVGASKGDGLGQLGLLPIAGDMRTIDRNHALRMAGADCVPSGLGGAQRLEVKVAHPGFIQAGGKLALGKAGFARCRNGAHVDQQRDPCLLQRRDNIVNSALLVTDGEQLGHDVACGMIGSQCRRRPGSTTMRIGFTGKRAVVCEGSRGVGRSVALRYAHDGIRADVVAPGSIEFLSGA
jgi:hypothetical protein